MAKAWATKREAELGEPGAIERANRQGVSIKEVIEQYLDEYERIRPLGKTKRQALKAISETWLAQVVDSDLNSQRLVEFAQWRMTPAGSGVQAQTLGKDLGTLARSHKWERGANRAQL